MFHALIRTHHITSRKKVARLKAAAKTYQCFALLRSGGIPGVMYVCGEDKPNVQGWVDTVHHLRYKDYQLAAPVEAMDPTTGNIEPSFASQRGLLREVDTVKAMAAIMEQAGQRQWWRRAMGFSSGNNNGSS